MIKRVIDGVSQPTLLAYAMNINLVIDLVLSSMSS